MPNIFQNETKEDEELTFSSKQGAISTPAFAVNQNTILPTSSVSTNFIFFATTRNASGNLLTYFSSGSSVLPGIIPKFELSTTSNLQRAIALTDSLTTHGITNAAPTNVYGRIEKSSDTGGVAVIGMGTDATSIGLGLQGILGSATPTAGNPATYIDALKKNGASVQALSGTDGVIGIFNNAGSALLYIMENGNVGINTPSQFGSGVKVIGIANATTTPTANPTGGGVLYCDAGALKYRGSSGTITTIAGA